jgi:hypothetical protein
VIFADDFVLLAKEVAMLQGMIERLTETGRYYGMEMNMEKIKAMRISRHPSQIQILIDHMQPENVEYFNFWVTCYHMLHDVRVKLNPGVPWQQQHSTSRRLLSPANWTSI